MKKRILIYLFSLLLGVVIGVISYNLIRFYVPSKVEEKKLDYKEYVRIKENLSYINVDSGENIDGDTSFNKLVGNVFNMLDLGSVLTPLEENCIYVNCRGKLTDYILNVDILETSMRNMYGVDRKFNLDNFVFYTDYHKGDCKLNKEDNNYICTLSDTNNEVNMINYKVINAKYNEKGDIILSAYAYFKKEGCDEIGNTCVYSDKNLRHMIFKGNQSEIEENLYKLNIVNIVYKKNSNNDYYLYTLKW